MKKIKIKDLTIISMFVAIIAIMSFVPYIGFITIGPLSFTIVHIVVIIGAIILGPYAGLTFGIAFGLFSLIRSATGGVNDLTFIYPWVSILPRALFGFFAGWFYKFLKKRMNMGFAVAIVAIVSTILHTYSVFIVYYPTYLWAYNIPTDSFISEGAVGFGTFSGPIFGFCLAIFSFNCIFETLAAALIASPICIGLNKFLTLDDDLSKDEIDALHSDEKDFSPANKEEKNDIKDGDK